VGSPVLTDHSCHTSSSDSLTTQAVVFTDKPTPKQMSKAVRTLSTRSQPPQVIAMTTSPNLYSRSLNGIDPTHECERVIPTKPREKSASVPRCPLGNIPSRNKRRRSSNPQRCAGRYCPLGNIVKGKNPASVLTQDSCYFRFFKPFAGEDFLARFASVRLVRESRSDSAADLTTRQSLPNRTHSTDPARHSLRMWTRVHPARAAASSVETRSLIAGVVATPHLRRASAVASAYCSLPTVLQRRGRDSTLGG